MACGRCSGMAFEMAVGQLVVFCEVDMTEELHSQSGQNDVLLNFDLIRP